MMNFIGFYWVAYLLFDLEGMIPNQTSLGAFIDAVTGCGRQKAKLG